MKFDPGFPIDVDARRLLFKYGEGVFGPKPEYRRLDGIRASLHDPSCEGPDPVYAIAMDVGKYEHRMRLLQDKLLFGVVAFAAGRLGREPLRSQGHVHRVSCHSGWSPPEIFEIWSGRAVVYIQESAAEDAGRCFAVAARIGQVVVVPPGWAHTVISADPAEPLIFGAWCDREYGFIYNGIREKGGLAWYPLLDENHKLTWLRNPRYRAGPPWAKPPESYRSLGLKEGISIYRQFEEHPEGLQWVSQPYKLKRMWNDFLP